VRTLEWAIADRGFQEGWLTPVKAPLRSGKRVAIVGSGPAGLAAAQQLARLGHSVTVYEKADRVGGLLRYGIPDFKMEKGILERRLEQLRAEGVQFECGVDVGADSAALGALLSGSDAVGLAIGAEKPRELSLPGRLLKGVHLAMEYLEQANRAQAGMAPPPGGWISAQGKRILILGGGDTGSDCLGTAHRQGCLSATQVEIQPEPPKDRAATTPWPYWPLQLRTSHAHEEGGSRFWSVETLELLGDAQGRVKQIRARMGGAAGGERLLDAELVLIAAGFTGVRTGGLVERLGVKLDARGAIATDAQFKTSVPKVFAAGDARRGASLIVWAIAEGRRMAESIHRALSGGS
jgi:glutamate synthase (NADPH/NADH) small chain